MSSAHREQVNHPDHYNQGDIECIDALESALGSAGYEGFCIGNALKYLWRAPHKGVREQDLRKARWYIDRLLPALQADVSTGAVEREVTGADIIDWADGIRGALGTEHASKVTAQEARIAEAIVKAMPEPSESGKGDGCGYCGGKRSDPYLSCAPCPRCSGTNTESNGVDEKAYPADKPNIALDLLYSAVRNRERPLGSQDKQRIIGAIKDVREALCERRKTPEFVKHERAAIDSTLRFVDQVIKPRRCDSDGVSGCWRCQTVYLASVVRRMLPEVENHDH